MPANTISRGHGPLLRCFHGNTPTFLFLLMSQLREHNDQTRLNQRFQ
jgi:hypothetical protein